MLFPSPVRTIFWLYLEACFVSIDVGAFERAELEKLTAWNRDLARIMLAAGCLLLLPLIGLALASSVGGVSFFGFPAHLCAVAAVVAWMLAQVLLVGLLLLLCMFCMEWEPFGFVLALAELLHTSPEVLQNLWRAMVVCPPLVLLFCHGGS